MMHALTPLKHSSPPNPTRPRARFPCPPQTTQIILNGKLTVTAGRDGFQCEAGPWTVLAAEAVTADYGEYAPGA